MTDLTSTLASLQRLAEEVERLNASDEHYRLFRQTACTSAPLLASAVLALVEVARAVDHERNLVCQDIGLQLKASEAVEAALTRLSALSPKEGE